MSQSSSLSSLITLEMGPLLSKNHKFGHKLQCFDFIVEYRKGELNHAPDALSRIPPNLQCCLYNKQKEENISISLEKLWEEQYKDSKVEEIIKQLIEKEQKNLTGICCPRR